MLSAPWAVNIEANKTPTSRGIGSFIGIIADRLYARNDARHPCRRQRGAIKRDGVSIFNIAPNKRGGVKLFNRVFLNCFCARVESLHPFSKSPVAGHLFNFFHLFSLGEISGAGSATNDIQPQNDGCAKDCTTMPGYLKESIAASLLACVQSIRKIESKEKSARGLFGCEGVGEKAWHHHRVLLRVDAI